MSRYPLFTPRFRLTFMAVNVQFAFPFKLHALIDDAEKDGRDDIVSWIQDGKAFQIHKPKEFTNLLLPKHFDSIQYRSIQRQLHIYGFQLLKKSGRAKATPMRGAYAHELFIKGNRELCQHMIRRKMSDNRRKKDGKKKKRNSNSELKRNQASLHLNNILKLDQDLFFDRSMEKFTAFQPSNTSISVDEMQSAQLKQKLDELLWHLGGESDGAALRDGDATFFEGKQFHFVECEMESS